MSLLPRSFMLPLLFAAAACGASADDPGDLDPGDTEVVSIELQPAAASLEIVDGASAEQAYSVLATLSSGDILEVSADAAFSVDDPILGTFAVQSFRASGAAGGETTVRALYKGATADAQLSVTVKSRRVEDGAPAEAIDLFDGATSEDAGLAPSLVYPADGVYVPPNLGVFEAHWTGQASTNLYEISLTTDYSETKFFTAKDASAGGAFAAFTPDEWSVVGETARGQQAELRIRALNTSSPTSVGVSDVQTVRLTSTDIEGGIYYWASQGTLAGGVYRHDMSRPGENAEPFYTTGESPDGRCVACHVLSRDGAKMAVTYDGGNGAASIVDVASQTPTLATDNSYQWNFASFEPSGDRIVTVRDGVMTLRDVATGAVVNTVPTTGYATHVDFAPTGDKIVYVQVASPSVDWEFSGGSLVVQSFDAGSAGWGTPTVLFTPPAGSNAFYPSFSPDGNWVLFNQSTANAYDTPSAALFVTRSDGSMDPLELANPNLQSGLTNSWPRWAPFLQELRQDGGVEEFFWLTFSSKRAFGVRLPPGTPQLWMTPFFPSRVVPGGDPAGAAFWLPFQEIGTNNHIAQWTTQIIPVD